MKTLRNRNICEQVYNVCLTTEPDILKNEMH